MVGYGGFGLWGYPYYGGYGGYGGNYDGGSYPVYGDDYYAPAYSTPSYGPNYQVPPANTSMPARLPVAIEVRLLPDPQAQLWVDGAATTMQGVDRIFVSPPVETGYSYTYTVRATWNQNGQPVTARIVKSRCIPAGLT